MSWSSFSAFDNRKTGDIHIASASCRARAPDLLALAERWPQRYPFLLESSAGAAAQSRYDLLLAFPDQSHVFDLNPEAPDFFRVLDECAHTPPAEMVPGLPFVGGWFFYASYELAGRVEPSLCLPAPRDDALPAALAVRCPAAIVHDRRDQVVHLISENEDDAHIVRMHDDLLAADGAAPTGAPLAARWREESPARYLAQVAAARELIHAGDVFQVNLSRAWHADLWAPASPGTVYAALRRANPAPFSALVQWQGGALACSSPERLLLLKNGVAQTRPIAGTRRRTAGSDAAMTRELLAHPKERAEHVMLIDLERNDLGRICDPGSIAVDELMISESYAHVHHIVSNVCGRLRANVGPGAALRAMFPGGTITGCPKVRCMEIIAEFEAEGRGAYTGSVGYLSRCGRMDSNIVIRSLTQRGQRLTLRTGAGVVADSIPEMELEETRIKARGVLRSFVDQAGAAHG